MINQSSMNQKKARRKFFHKNFLNSPTHSNLVLTRKDSYIINDTESTQLNKMTRVLEPFSQKNCPF